MVKTDKPLLLCVADLAGYLKQNHCRMKISEQDTLTVMVGNLQIKILPQKEGKI